MASDSGTSTIASSMATSWANV